MTAEHTNQSRRRFLQGVLISLGAGLSNGLIGDNALAAALNYRVVPDGEPYQTKVLSKEQLMMLKKVCNTIIPRTETPGAGDIGVHGFIDHQLYHCYDLNVHSRMRAILSVIETSSLRIYGYPFTELDSERQVVHLTRLETAAEPFSEQQRTDFKQLKALVCFGYYTSETGASHELVYQAYPGGFKGQIAYRGQAGFGSLAYY
ncbi:gluconate 2-dehydrogenase subunit 3 family protein [Pseudoalteromonas sp. DL2-H2.2]|uniref:gluconate 2-dehydrogenase subunit 3 family protein n=1 Tax=Pseudoalteromonas sp. DL2-H2.2 TaxID=2908889 RepID=UPI001F286506|nr:gluconate 2-dehydrogenase subunit 3 family protein [Pseudoalteromonas sp. DL2-H2.2]MCF2909347.1 gluconate 2-dehydrogenase subunit 3 family protein [Pseudoalteromonas sp. DL2-H2.2]